MRKHIDLQTEFKISKNKFVSFGFIEEAFCNSGLKTWSWFSFRCACVRKEDHPSFNFALEILGFHLFFNPLDYSDIINDARLAALNIELGKLL
jgi:hypothetical protein